jgi:uncharacterized protein (DUF362 family)
MRKRYTRRDFLRHAGQGGLALATAKLLTGCGPWPAPTDVITPPGSATDKHSRVVAVRGTDLAEMTRAALAAFGGAAALIQPGESVFLKPNLVGAGTSDHELFTTGECTKPELVVAVAEECLRAGAGQVINGDAAQTDRFAWDKLLTLDGSTSLATEAERLNLEFPGRVTLACLNADTPEWDVIPSPNSGLGELRVSSVVAGADRIISLPVLKTHRLTRLTLSLKNFMGVTPLAYYQVAGITYRIKLHEAPGGLESAFLDVVDHLRPDFTLIDASIGVEGNGPYAMPGVFGTTVDVRDRLGSWLLLASDDLVAADATAARTETQHLAALKALARGFSTVTRVDDICRDLATAARIG